MSLQPFTKTFPVEIVGRILSYALASPSDDPQKLPSARPHPVAVLLVCKETTRALLPVFYRSIKIFKPMDWFTLFNSEYGILGLDESDKPKEQRRLPALAIRKRWVHELFIGITDKGHPVGPPINNTKIVEYFRSRQLPAEYTVYVDPAFVPWMSNDRLFDLGPVRLPDLDVLVVFPVGPVEYDPELRTVFEGRNNWHQCYINASIDAALCAELDRADLQWASFRTVHLRVDSAFQGLGKYAAIETIYQRATNARIAAYMDIPRDPDEHHDLLALIALVPYYQEDDQRAFSLSRDVSLVGSETDLKLWLELSDLDDEEEDAVKDWEWLAPDGRRRTLKESQGSLVSVSTSSA